MNKASKLKSEYPGCEIENNPAITEPLVWGSSENIFSLEELLRYNQNKAKRDAKREARQQAYYDELKAKAMQEMKEHKKCECCGHEIDDD